MRSGLLAALLLSLWTRPALSAPAWGITVDAGVPDGACASLVWRPTPRLRLHVGAGHNLVSPGVRAGVNVSLFPYWITPALSLEAGHYTDGDANPLARMLSGDQSIDEPVLRDIGYDYLNGHAGLELGHSRLTFYVHAGVSVVRGELHGFNESIAMVRESGQPSIEVRTDPQVTAFTPSGRLGLVYYF